MKSCFFEGLENKIIVKNDSCEEVNISTDTRTIKTGDFYLPLKGESFDGEKFIDKAIESGAIGFLTTSNDIAKQYEKDSRVKLVAVVPDTKLAYMELASARIKKIEAKVVGITGSSGKTTVKEMVYSVLSQSFKTHKTSLNHNNEVGFCQTVFEAPLDTEVLVLEMGMRGLGEIELLASYAKPDIAIVTNVGTAHIGRLGSRENIAIAKCEIAKFLSLNGVFIAQDDALTRKTIKFNGEKKFYSVNDTQIVSQQIGESEFVYEGEKYFIPIEGRHNIENSLAAILAGKSLGMDDASIKQGLAAYKTIENRWNIEEIGRFNIINDCYNANPESMKATIDTVLNLYTSPCLVLGNMGELGEDSKKYHIAIGEFINSHPKMSKAVSIITVGDLAKNIFETVNSHSKVHFDTTEKVADYILKNNNIRNILFFKASRSMHFEQIINKIKGDLE